MIYRDATADEMALVYATFTHSFRKASTHAEGLSDRQVAELATNLIVNGWRVTVAEVADGLVAAWAMHREKQEVAWWLTKSIFRNQGIARGLLEAISCHAGYRIVTPFLPNRNTALLTRYKLTHRPFLAVLT